MKNLKQLPTALVAIFCLLLFSFNSSAQNVGINESGAAPDPSALLDLSATDKGFLITRVDTASIASPAFGLMTLAPIDSCLYLYNGNNWMGMGGVGINCSFNCNDSEDTPPETSCGLTCGDDITDTRDSRTYKTVKIGNQCWMSENLAYLPSVVGPNMNSTTAPYYYVYGYNGTDVATAKNEVNYSTYGVLYNWPAAMDGASSSSSNPSGTQGVCPDCWHLPSDAEWKQLEMEMGMTQAEADGTTLRGTNEGNALKSPSPGWNGNNSSDFTALPGGSRDANGTFTLGGEYGRWWSTTQNNTRVWSRSLMNHLSGVYRLDYGKGNGFSVRCIKD